jgi:hypothetical protein
VSDCSSESHEWTSERDSMGRVVRTICSGCGVSYADGKDSRGLTLRRGDMVSKTFLLGGVEHRDIGRVVAINFGAKGVIKVVPERCVAMVDGEPRARPATGWSMGPSRCWTRLED